MQPHSHSYNSKPLNPVEQKDYAHLEHLPEVRISVANIIAKIKSSDGREGYLGIIYDKARQKGIEQYIAVGGGAELYDTGRNFLQNRFAADPSAFEGNDARFKAPGKYVAGILTTLGNQKTGSHLIERSVERELLEEFIDEQNPGNAVLTKSEIESCQLVCVGSYRQPVNTSQGGSLNTGGSVTARLFFVYNMHVTPQIYDKIASHSSMKILSAQEVATTAGGLKTGSTKTGAVIGDNLFEIEH